MPIKITFFLMMLMGINITITSSSWVTAWMGLEINLISFLPLMMTTNNKLPNEAALKYFLIQALASAFLMFAILTSPLPSSDLPLNASLISSSILALSLVMKLGGAPFHFWFPPAMEGLSWGNCVILATIQKIAPLALLSVLTLPALFYIALLSALVGAIGGFNQLSLRKLISYSSIGHMGWMILISQVSLNFTALYLMTYMYLSSLIMMMFASFGLHHLSQMTLYYPSPTSLIMFFNLLSLGGLPPFLGFLPKWSIIQQLSSQQAFFALSILIFSSLVTLFYYMRVTYFAFTKHSSFLLASPPINASLPLLLASSPSFLFLPLGALWALT